MIRELRKKNVIQPVERRNPDLCGYLYLPLDRRKQGNEPVLPRLHRGKRRLDVVDEDVKTYGQRDYERMHET